MEQTVGPQLWPHQVEAVEKISAELGKSSADRQGCRRATAVAACGTGKTIVGAECSRRLAPDGRVLVLVPTLELLAQTAHAYAAHLGAAAGVIAAVCGDHKATELAAELRAEMDHLHAPVTTDPLEIARLAGRRGRITVFATYASLSVILAAHAEHQLPRWTMVVIDEAHRTAGVKGRWAQVHDDRLLPARCRLYLTATPRIMTVGGADIVSMDDPAVFGPQVFHLPFAAAIDTGLLADYRVAVVTVTDAEVAKLTAPHRVVTIDGRAVSARMLAMQIALAKAIRDYRLRRVITYHGRVASATRFAAGLRTAIELLPGADRPARPVQARWVSGDMAPRHRRYALAELRDPGESTVVIANARVLAEGVDVPALDAVMFADPRDSATDVVQAVGRALRRGHDTGKTATVIVPIFLTEGENPEAALDGSEFDTVWRVVRALRAHDERIADYLDARRQDSWRRGRASRDAEPVPRWLHIDGAPAHVGDEFHRSILLRTVETTTSAWWENYGALVAFHAEHGHLTVPKTYRTPRGGSLSAWLAACRRAYRAGLLPADRAARLEALGINWTPQRGWQRGISELCAYHREYGTAEVPHDYVTANGYQLGAWLGGQRRRHRDGLLTDAESAELRALGIDPADRRRRDPKHEARWAGNIAAAAAFRAEHGHLDIPDAYRTPEGHNLGKWLRHCRDNYDAGTLRPERIAQLEALGVDWRPFQTQWQRTVDALRAFRDVHGHLSVPQGHVTSDGLQLGRWLSSNRSKYRLGQLAPERIAQLDELGVDWDPIETAWRTGVHRLTEYHRRNGTGRVPLRYVTADGYKLGNWVNTQRRNYRAGRLTADQIAALETLGMDWEPFETLWDKAIDALIAYRKEHGTADVLQKYVTADGFHLGTWLSTRRKQYRTGTLDPARAAQLEALGVSLEALGVSLASSPRGTRRHSSAVSTDRRGRGGAR
ncbi:DEAD/DEAH box helicase [Nocardia amamiensis]|uniref:DEAD/DEAH box helicase n=1 Tax=Nocardia amamiensis TaxID=404578 RepID=UPI0008372B2E|nr:DEAD/DEAH box helicase [Nocardia amamiensis]